MKKFMVVEKFKPNCFEKNDYKYNKEGRLLPEGLYYLNSWVNKEENICFQLMETNNVELFNVWIENWKEFTDFKVYTID